MKRILFLIVFLSSLIINSGCSIHNFINKEINPNGKIAIIIADTRYNDVNNLIATSISELLESKTRLTVVHQHDIKAVMVEYPERIRGPYKLLGDEVDFNPALHDLDTLAKYASKLNVQYLYVFWVPVGIDNKYITIMNGVPHESSGLSYYTFVGELIEFPSRKIVAQAQTDLAYIPDAIVLGPGRMAKNTREMAEYFAESVVEEIISETKIGR